jgi:tRNA(Arg) A34 adenosine deaminase TadA
MEDGSGPISREAIPALARSILDAIPEDDERIAGWKAMLEGYVPDEAYVDDDFALVTCALALQAVAEGNGGIGCVLVDAAGRTIACEHNRVFYPYFRSDLHGEMSTMDRFEDMRLEVPPGDLTLYSSLEPCPMCLVRLVTAGIGKVLYLARDELWGMTEDRDKLPPTWKDLSEGKVFGTADCSPELLDASSQIFNINIDELYEILKKR